MSIMETPEPKFENKFLEGELYPGTKVKVWLTGTIKDEGRDSSGKIMLNFDPANVNVQINVLVESDRFGSDFQSFELKPKGEDNYYKHTPKQ